MMDEGSIQNCPICLEPLPDSSDEELINLLPCEHVFHPHCLSEWFRVGTPGNYCPLCRSVMPGMEEDESSSSEDEEDADEIPSSVPGSEEPAPGLEQNPDQIPQSVLQHIVVIEEGFTEIENHLNDLRIQLGQAQEFVSGLVPSTTTEQEELDTLREALSEVEETINNIQEDIDEALHIMPYLQETRDRSTMLEMVNNLSNLHQSVRERTVTLHEIIGRVGNLTITSID